MSLAPLFLFHFFGGSNWVLHLWSLWVLKCKHTWSFFQGQLGSVSSSENQPAAGSSQIYGTSHQSDQANTGSQGTFSYRSGSVPVGFYALQRENVFPERPGQPECQFYMKTGDCKFGAVCKFHHPRERLIPAPDCLLSPMGLPLRPVSLFVCFFFRVKLCLMWEWFVIPMFMVYVSFIWGFVISLGLA